MIMIPNWTILAPTRRLLRRGGREKTLQMKLVCDKDLKGCLFSNINNIKFFCSAFSPPKALYKGACYMYM